MRIRRRHKLYSIILASMLCVCLSSCGEKVVEEEPIIAVDRKPDDITYNLDEVTRGNVEKSKNINCEYVQTKEQEVCFTEGGKIIDKVYVRKGDRVKKGDVLVELKSENLDVQILDLEYENKKLNLQLSYLDINEEFDKKGAHNTMIHSQLTGDDFCRYDDEIKEIERSYKYQREDINDSINFNNKKIEELKKELNGKKICSTIDGTVISVKSDLEGSVSKRGAVLMTVVDNSTGLFETNDPELLSLVKPGDILKMSIVYGSAKGEYEITPLSMEKWEMKQQFSIVSAPENEGIEVGTSGTIRLVIENRENVLRIPFSALYEADGKYYTYTVNADNLREVKYFEPGLIGDDYVEVLSGLSEKEKVIKK